ncbi:hypothetical protein NRF20_24295 [Streptomyces sp. R-74717]|uniref:hypothetical protein n=1 Tax=Streptomyces TaxID=1883 RepID=UPI0037B4EDB6
MARRSRSSWAIWGWASRWCWGRVPPPISEIGTAGGGVVVIGVADVTLARDDIETLARRALAIIRGKLLWAFGYHVVIIQLAVVGLLNPMLAADGAAGRCPARRSDVCGPSGSSSALPG